MVAAEDLATQLEVEMRIVKRTCTALVSMLFATSAFAQGPVATACKDDIAVHCAGKSHVNREIRNCLEANKAKVSAACRAVLETTGMGGMGGMNGGGMGGMGK